MKDATIIRNEETKSVHLITSVLAANVDVKTSVQEEDGHKEPIVQVSIPSQYMTDVDLEDTINFLEGALTAMKLAKVHYTFEKVGALMDSVE